MNRMVRHSLVLASGLALGVLGGCGAQPTKTAAPATTSSTSPSTTSTATTTTASLEAGAPTTVPTALVDDCVDYVQYGAFTGDSLLLGMWDDANQDATTLSANCTALGLTDLSALATMSSEWTDIQTFIAASQTTQAIPPSTQPTPPPTAPPTPTTEAPETTEATAPPVVTEPADTPPVESCGEGSYVNVDGNCISGPVEAPSAPAGATAQCRDGTYSFSQHRGGTCSHHGGVATWL